MIKMTQYKVNRCLTCSINNGTLKCAECCKLLPIYNLMNGIEAKQI